jgi:hypothetical protein
MRISFCIRRCIKGDPYITLGAGRERHGRCLPVVGLGISAFLHLVVNASEATQGVEVFQVMVNYARGRCGVLNNPYTMGYLRTFLSWKGHPPSPPFYGGGWWPYTR